MSSWKNAMSVCMVVAKNVHRGSCGEGGNSFPRKDDPDCSGILTSNSTSGTRSITMTLTNVVIVAAKGLRLAHDKKRLC